MPDAAGLLAAPPATGAWPPVAGPFCAIASEVPPAKSAATTVRVFKVVMNHAPRRDGWLHVARKPRHHDAWDPPRTGTAVTGNADFVSADDFAIMRNAARPLRITIEPIEQKVIDR